MIIQSHTSLYDRGLGDKPTPPMCESIGSDKTLREDDPLDIKKAYI